MESHHSHDDGVNYTEILKNIALVLSTLVSLAVLIGMISGYFTFQSAIDKRASTLEVKLEDIKTELSGIRSDLKSGGSSDQELNNRVLRLEHLHGIGLKGGKGDAVN